MVPIPRGWMKQFYLENLMPKKIALAIAMMSAALIAEAAKQKDVTLDLLGTYETGIFDDGAAEIVSYDPVTQRVFVINAADSTVDLLDISDPTSPTLASSIDVAPDIATTFPGSESGGINSVAVKNGIVAVVVENDDKQAFGWAATTRKSHLCRRLLLGRRGQLPAGARRDHGRVRPRPGRPAR